VMQSFARADDQHAHRPPRSVSPGESPELRAASMCRNSPLTRGYDPHQLQSPGTDVSALRAAGRSWCDRVGERDGEGGPVEEGRATVVGQQLHGLELRRRSRPDCERGGGLVVGSSTITNACTSPKAKENESRPPPSAVARSLTAGANTSTRSGRASQLSDQRWSCGSRPSTSDS
jgi:hypothetical protein